MIAIDTPKTTRRGFLEKMTAVAAVAPVMTTKLFAAPQPADISDPPASSPYRSLDPSEIAFTERLTDVLCPADLATPSGTACGLVHFIDWRLNGEFGGECARAAWEHGDGNSYDQLPLNQEQFFKSGIAAVDAACRQRFGAPFCELTASNASQILSDIAMRRVVDAHLPLVTWLNELVHPLLLHGSLSEPVHERYGNRVFWKLTRA